VQAKPDADGILAALTAGRDRIASLMYTVDTHPLRERLDAGTYTGATDRFRRDLGGEVNALWARFGTLRDILERATTLRGAGRSAEAELATLLTGPTVGLDADGLPVDPGSTTPTASRATVADFAGQTESRCGDVLRRLGAVEKSQAALTMEYARATAAVEEVAALAASLGEPGAVQPLRAAAAEIEALDLTDPLGAAPSGAIAGATKTRFDRLAMACATARDGMAAVVAARDGYQARRAALATRIDEVEAAERAVGQAQSLAAEKIAAPGLGPVPAAATVLRGRLKQLDDAVAGAQWRKVAADLSTVESSAGDALKRAGEARAAANGLIARRDELRGRLEAYRAKAVARRLAENQQLAPLFSHAHTVLFTAPCDLRAATRAVHAYQAALANLLGSGESARPSERSPRDG
jgi:hypothetical protein